MLNTIISRSTGIQPVYRVP